MNKALLFLCMLPLFFSLVAATETFTVNNVLLKVSLHQGESVVKTLGVTAIAPSSFEVSVDDLSGVTLSTGGFDLKAGEKKDITLDVNAELLEPGVYVGHITLKNSEEQIDIPVVLEIESQDVFFDLNLDIPPQYSQIAPGDKFIVQVKVFDLTGFKAAGSLGPSPVTLTYELKSVNGDVLSIESENIIVDKQAQLTKTFILPPKIREGEYFFTATARHKTSLGSASYFFVVRSLSPASNSFFTPEFIAILVAFGLFFLIVLAFIIYLVRDRNKLFAELYHYNEHELQHHEHLLRQQAKILEQKGAPRERVEKEVNAKLVTIRKSQEKRVNELKKMQQTGNVEGMKQKLSLWKRQGYSTQGLEHKLKGLSTKDMKRLMTGWKKSYRTEDYKNR